MPTGSCSVCNLCHRLLLCLNMYSFLKFIADPDRNKYWVRVKGGFHMPG